MNLLRADLGGRCLRANLHDPGAPESRGGNNVSAPLQVFVEAIPEGQLSGEAAPRFGDPWPPQTMTKRRSV